MPICNVYQLESQLEREETKEHKKTHAVHEDDDNNLNDTDATPLPTDEATVGEWLSWIQLFARSSCRRRSANSQRFLVGWVGSLASEGLLRHEVIDSSKNQTERLV